MRWLFASAGAVAAAACAAAIVCASACVLTTDFDGFSGGPPKSDGAVADGATTTLDGEGPPIVLDGGGDATVAEQLPGGGVIVATGTSAYAAGAAQQRHVHYAQNLGAWVFFYLSASQHDRILVRLTNDFVTFVDAPPVMLPREHDGEGRNFDVAYANLGGADIFHIAISMLDQKVGYAYHVRGRVQNGTLTYDSPKMLGQTTQFFPNMNPDAPAIAILPSGKVLLSSGFNDINGHVDNFCVYGSFKNDDGSDGFQDGFDHGTEVEAAKRAVNARKLLNTPTAPLGIWERGDQDPDSTDIGFSFFENGSWDGADSLDFPLTTYNANDWDAVETESGLNHVMRWSNGGYLHRYYDPSSGGQTGYAVPPATHSVGDGLLMLDVGGTATAFALNDGDRVLRRTQLDGTSWTAWSPVAPADASRHNISGNANAAGAAVVLWERVNGDGSSDLAALKIP